MGLDLITLAEYKAYKGMSSTSQDTIIKAILPKVSALVKTYCRRTFLDYVNDSKTDVFKGGKDFYLLKETPVLQVASVEFSDDFGLTYTAMTEYSDYVMENDEQLTLINDYFKNTTKPKAFKVTYNAGYEELPIDLKLGVMDLVTYYLRHEGALHTQKNVGANSVQIEYVTHTTLPANVRRVLDLHSAHYL